MERLKKCDILCLTETWLRPHELISIKHTISKYSGDAGKDYFVFAKSSMEDVDSSYAGRPFGGVSIITKKHKSFTAREIDIPCDRILAMGLYDNFNNLMQIIVCVYMPFYDGSVCQVTEYVEVIDILQTVIDKYGSCTQLMFMGDFNAQLPTARKLQATWYKTKGFNQFSCLLYDFICGNDLLAADLCFKQPVNYTYFSHSNNHYTWIDHAICIKRDFYKIKNCVIIPEDSENVSDHLPFQISFSITAHSNTQTKQYSTNNATRIPLKWGTHERQDIYRSILSRKLMDNFDSKKIPTGDVAQWVNDRFAAINSTIHEAATEAGCIPRRPQRAKPYWCPELSRLRDKKRFWWSIWVASGRPRNGTVFDIWKSLKKQFRRRARFNVQSILSRNLNIMNNLYKERQMRSFWNKLKQQQNVKTRSHLSADDLAEFYQSVMKDDGNLTASQTYIQNFVKERVNLYDNYKTNVEIEPNRVIELVKSLKKGTSPGHDGITVEHLSHGMSESLSFVLAHLYSVILSNAVVPNEFASGLVIPVLKKPTSDPNIPNNYRPITLSSVHSKIVELLIMPSNDTCNLQFGFKEGRGTAFISSTLHDCSAYYKAKGSPFFLCSLDAEKCFDSIWHDALLFKLWPVLPVHYWLLIYRWYKKSTATVSWNGKISRSFQITRGMRQGSVLSPTLFNIFLDELLQKLQTLPNGIRVFDLPINCCTYADDITLLSATVPGLQRLINLCVSYADKYRFKFNKKKSKCMVLGKNILTETPKWTIDQSHIETVNEVDILGINFHQSLNNSRHVDNRITACRKRMYGLASIGMSYPGLSTDVKTYLWNSVGAPILTYGMETLDISKTQAKKLLSAQGSVVKRVMGIPKRSHHNNLIQALGIKATTDTINNNTLNLYYRLFQCDSPARDLQCQFLAHYLLTNERFQGTIIDRIINLGGSPTEIAFYGTHKSTSIPPQDCNGVIDSLRHMLFNDNYIRPESNEHLIAMLLCNAF